jgi:hypothetical protein
VASAIAAATASQRLKTLLFTQTVTLANSATRTLNEALGAPNCELTVPERQSYEIALDEAGGAEHLYIEVTANNRLRSASACHHGLLLPSERHHHESLFRRPDGIHVLVATSTLAQGMNLPSEVVIIQGDSRFDPEANRLQRLEAHELLNAAGRAWRAGEGSYGFVLVVPSKVVHFDADTNRIAQHWGELQAIFARSDQCLTIDDPLAAVLDEIHNATAELSANAKYLVRRLPVGLTDADRNASTRNFLGRTLGAYRARARADQAWVETRMAAAIAARDRDPDGAEVLTWVDQLAAQAGVPVAAIRALSDWFGRQQIGPALTTARWRDLVWQWLEQSPENVPLLLRTESLSEFFGTAYSRLPDSRTRSRYALPVLRRLLSAWMEGATLADLEREFGTPEQRLGKCDRARQFVVRPLPELSYVFGLAHQVVRTQPDLAGVGNVALETLSACVREGFNRSEQFALRIVRGTRSGRRAVHREFALIGPYLEPRAARDTFPDVIRRVEQPIQARQREE